MPDANVQAVVACRQLPPLILHPFTDHDGAARLVENSRANLMLLGLTPSDGYSQEDLASRVAQARFAELRMLYFLGKDVFRWVGQCTECVAQIPELRDEGIAEQSFALLLTRNTPATVRQKLRSWGVADYSALFTRAMGINATFRQPPLFEALNEEFVLNYHRYADTLFACYQQLRSFNEIGPEQFTFELYGSREYAGLLEREWGNLDEPE